MLKADASRLDRLARKWWFFVLLLVLLFLPAYTSVPFNAAETPKLVIEVLSRSPIYAVPALFPVFKFIPIALVIGLLFLGDRLTRVFDAYVALNLLLCAVLQSMAHTVSYGFAVLLGNLVVYTLVGLLWVWEAVVKRNDLTPRVQPVWKYWVVPLALFAFWFPVSTTGATPSPDFSLRGLVANEAGLTLCMMVPVYLAVLTLYHPRVNGVVLRVMAFVGLFTGLLNVGEFFANASYGWWLGVVHLPLLIISIYAFALSWRRVQA